MTNAETLKTEKLKLTVFTPVSAFQHFSISAFGMFQRFSVSPFQYLV